MSAFNKDKSLTLEEVQDRFIVNPETGDIFWRTRGISRPLGKPVGTRLASGYRKIGERIDGVFIQYYSHHIVWTWVHGQWPDFPLDHVNGVKDDNRIINLRAASHRANRANVRATRNNKSGRKWVCLHKSSVEKGSPKPWQAAVWFGKDRRQKYFSNPDEAYVWAKATAKELHGEFYNPGD